MDLNTKLEGIKRTFTFGVSPEAGANRYQMTVTVDFSNTTIQEIIDTWTKKSVVVAMQNNNFRKRGEEWLKNPANRTQEGLLEDLTKSTRKGQDITSLSPEELASRMTPEQKRETKKLMIQEWVDEGRAEWVDEDELKFEFVE